MLLLSDRMDSLFYYLCSKTCLMRSTYLSVGRTLPRSILVELSTLKYFLTKICMNHFFIIIISHALSTVCFECSIWIYFYSLLAILRTNKTEEVRGQSKGLCREVLNSVGTQVPGWCCSSESIGLGYLSKATKVSAYAE